MIERGHVPGSDTEVLPDYQKDKNRPSNSGSFYGWWIVLAGTAILFVSSGIGFYGHGVILDPLRELHGWSKATVSSAITLYFFTSGIMGMIIGRQVDRYGPKWVLILGAVVIGIGFLLLSFISSVWQLYVLYCDGGSEQLCSNGFDPAEYTKSDLFSH